MDLTESARRYFFPQLPVHLLILEIASPWRIVLGPGSQRAAQDRNVLSDVLCGLHRRRNREMWADAHGCHSWSATCRWDLGFVYFVCLVDFAFVSLGWIYDFHACLYFVWILDSWEGFHLSSFVLILKFFEMLISLAIWFVAINRCYLCGLYLIDVILSYNLLKLKRNYENCVLIFGNYWIWFLKGYWFASIFVSVHIITCCVMSGWITGSVG